MRSLNIIFLALLACLIGGCSDLRGARLLAPEHFGLTPIDKNIYIEAGADEKAKAELRDAMTKAESTIHAAYGGVVSHPVVHACISEDCYKSFGGMGSRAKVYGDRILLSPRGFNWPFLAHDWSHAEIRTRLTFGAWWRLPQWFDEGLAVTISTAPSIQKPTGNFLWRPMSRDQHVQNYFLTELDDNGSMLFTDTERRKMLNVKRKESLKFALYMRQLATKCGPGSPKLAVMDFLG